MSVVWFFVSVDLFVIGSCPLFVRQKKHAFGLPVASCPASEFVTVHPSCNLLSARIVWRILSFEGRRPKGGRKQEAPSPKRVVHPCALSTCESLLSCFERTSVAVSSRRLPSVHHKPDFLGRGLPRRQSPDVDCESAGRGHRELAPSSSPRHALGQFHHRWVLWLPARQSPHQLY